MRRFRMPHILMTGAVGALTTALTVAAVGCGPDKATVIAAGWLVDAVLILSGTVLSALTALAGVLLVADMRSDSRCDQAWQCNNELSALAIEVPANPNPTVGWELDYAAGPQDERLRAILRAHRFPTALAATGVVKAEASTCAEGSVAVWRALPNVNTAISINGSTIDRDYSVPQADKTELAAIRPGLALIAKTTSVEPRSADAVGHRMQRHHRAMRSTPKVRRVANAEPCWNWHDQGVLASPRSTFFGRGADVIILADRSGGIVPQPLADHSADATAPAQPACRGPPSNAVAGRLSPPRSAFSREHRPNVDAATESDVLVVVDNLGETVPMGAAELSVIETFLDDVLRDVLTGVGSGLDDSTT
jgi:hypothetical protein